MVRLNLQLFAINKAVMMADTGSSGKKNLNNTTNTTKATTTTGTKQPSYSSFNASSKATNAQSEADDYLEKVKQMASVTDIIDQNTWNKINSTFSSSNAYKEAMAFTQGLLDKLSTGKTSYTDQIKDLMGQIQNREDFEYDVDNDALFQQALASAMSSGKSAMQDTIGQASALTGGYASTYATSAGNQAYNAFIEDAYNNLPEYYQMALDAYQMEGQEMYNQLAMLNQADQTEYQRLYDSWNANFTNAQNMYNQEYGAWQDSVNNAINSAGLQLQEYGQLFNQAYSAYNATQSYANTIYQNEYQKWADDVSNAFKSAQIYNDNYWNTQNFIQGQEEFNKEMEYKENALKQENEQFYARLAQDNSQFIATNDANGDGVVNYMDAIAEGSVTSSGSGDYKAPTQTQKEEALEAYNTGGEEAYFQYIDSLPSNVNVEEIDLYVNGDGVDNKGYGQLPLAQRTYTKVKETTNWLGGDDNDDMVQDQYGNVYSISQLPASIRRALSDLEQGKSYTYTAK